MRVKPVPCQLGVQYSAIRPLHLLVQFSDQNYVTIPVSSLCVQGGSWPNLLQTACHQPQMARIEKPVQIKYKKVQVVETN